MRKQKIEELLDEYRIEKEVTKRVKFRCVAFWSLISSLAGIMGAIISANIKPVKIGLKAFWEAWLSQ